MSAAPCMTYDTLAQEEGYVTVPMVAFTPVFQQPDEEELYTSFEEAISDRLTALHDRLSRLSDPALHTLSRSPYRSLGTAYQTSPLAIVWPTTDAAARTPDLGPIVRKSRWSWRRSIFYICLALIFSLIGFDLMGLLILNAR